MKKAAVEDLRTQCGN